MRCRRKSAKRADLSPVQEISRGGSPWMAIPSPSGISGQVRSSSAQEDLHGDDRSSEVTEEWRSHQDRQIIVVQKPAGLLTVATEDGENEITLQSELYHRLRKKVARTPPLFSVQRLDLETSGVLVVARTASSGQHQASVVEQQIPPQISGHLSGTRLAIPEPSTPASYRQASPQSTDRSSNDPVNQRSPTGRFSNAGMTTA